MALIQGFEMTSSMDARCLGSGSNIFLITGLQALGVRLLIVGGQAETAWLEFAHAVAYAP